MGTSATARGHTIGSRVLRSVGLALMFSVIMGGAGLFALHQTITASQRISGNHLPAMLAARDIGSSADAVRLASARGDDATAATDQAHQAIAAYATVAASVDQEQIDRAHLLVDTLSAGSASQRADATNELTTLIETFTHSEQEHTDKAAAAIDASFAQCVVLVVASVGAALIIGGRSGRKTARGITNDLAAVVGIAHAMGEGDFSRRLKPTRDDELGAMGRALDGAMDSLATVIATVREAAGTVATAAEELEVTSGTIANGASATAHTGASLAHAASEVTHHVEAVAAGTEQMGASIHEISTNAAHAMEVSADAVRKAQGASTTIEELGQASQQIGGIVKTITEIAEQTNLLALNATIEAARAGELGKGFAVVASEVKELAQETSRATDEISQRVAAIQRETDEAMSAIEQIRSVIGDVDEFQASISAAVEEQTATAAEMARGISEAARHSGSISDTMQQVADASELTASGVEESRAAVTSLARMSETLLGMVAPFKV